MLLGGQAIARRSVDGDLVSTRTPSCNTMSNLDVYILIWASLAAYIRAASSHYSIFVVSENGQ